MEGALQGPSPAPQLLLPIPGPPEGTAVGTPCPPLSCLLAPAHPWAAASPGLTGSGRREGSGFSLCLQQEDFSSKSPSGQMALPKQQLWGFPSPGQERRRAGLL